MRFSNQVVLSINRHDACIQYCSAYGTMIPNNVVLNSWLYSVVYCVCDRMAIMLLMRLVVEGAKPIFAFIPYAWSAWLYTCAPRLWSQPRRSSWQPRQRALQYNPAQLHKGTKADGAESRRGVRWFGRKRTQMKRCFVSCVSFKLRTSTSQWVALSVIAGCVPRCIHL